MENVWYGLSANKLFFFFCKEAWDFLIGDPDRIKSIGSRSWACVET